MVLVESPGPKGWNGGGFGPTVGAPVAMGYVGNEHRRPGTVVQAVVRGKQLPAEVVALPFVERRYHRG